VEALEREGHRQTKGRNEGKPYTWNGIRSQLERRRADIEDYLNRQEEHQITESPNDESIVEPQKPLTVVKHQKERDEEMILSDVYEIMEQKCTPEEREWWGRGKNKPEEQKDAFQTIGVRVPRELKEAFEALPGKITPHVEKALKLYLMVLNTKREKDNDS